MALPYIIIPNPSNPTRPFRARVKLGPVAEQDEVLTAVATDSGVSRADVEKVLNSLFKISIGFLRLGRPIGYLLGLLRFTPSITGSFSTNQPSDNEIKNGAGFTATTGPVADAAFSHELTVEKVDEEGVVAPEIDAITLSQGGQADVYSTTEALRFSGDHFRGSGQNQPWPSVVMLDASLANPITLLVVACSQTEVFVAPPPNGTTGTKRIKVVAGWDNSISTLYSRSLTHV